MREKQSDQSFLRPARGQSRRRGHRGPIARAFRLLLAVALGILAIIASSFSYSYLETSPHLALTEVSFEGTERTSELLLQSTRDAVLGDNILSIDLEQIEVHLRDQEPWIASTTVRRIFPDSVAVRVVEHRAVASIADGTALLTNSGLLLPVTPALATDAGLPRLQTTADPSLDELTRAVELLELLQRAPLSGQPLAARLTTLDATDRDDLVIRLEDTTYSVHIGSSDFKNKLNRFHNIEPLLEARYDGLTSVDLRYRDRVVVAPVHGSTGNERG